MLHRLIVFPSPSSTAHLTHCSQNIQDLISAERDAIDQSPAPQPHVTHPIMTTEEQQESSRPNGSSQDRLNDESLNAMCTLPPSPERAVEPCLFTTHAASADAVIFRDGGQDELRGQVDEMKDDLGVIEIDVVSPDVHDAAAATQVCTSERMSPTIAAQASPPRSIKALRLPVSSHHSHIFSADGFSPSNYISSFNILRLSFHKCVPVPNFIFPPSFLYDAPSRTVFLLQFDFFSDMNCAAASITTPL